MTSFRQDVRNNLYTGLVAFQVANPTLVGTIYKARPGSLEPPCIFIGTIDEPTITHDSGTRARDARVGVVIVQRLIDAVETLSAQDLLVDTFLDYATANPRLLTAFTVQQPISTREIELDYAGTIYSATVVTLQAMIQEGRL